MAVKKDGAKICDVPCQIWLPETPREKPIIFFSSKDDDHSTLLSPPYDLEATIVGFRDTVDAIVRAQRVYVDDLHCEHIGKREVNVSGFFDPELLTIIEPLSGDRPNDVTHIYIDITNNKLLEPVQSIERHWTGNRKVTTHRTHKIKVPVLGALSFTKHYKEQETDSRDESMLRRHLVAEAKCSESARTLAECDSRIRTYIESPLLIASFAARQSTVATGWMAIDSSHRVSCYRTNISIPDERPRSNFTLIHPPHFMRFFKAAVKAYERFDPESKMLIRQALFKVLPSRDKTVETRYLILFSALESIILWFRRLYQYEMTIESSAAWRRFNEDVRGLVKTHSAFSDEEKKGMVIAMLPQLRRIPLRTAYDAFCSQFSVDTTDIWPVFGARGCLADVRNKITHGEAFQRSAFDALIRAEASLEVTVERLLLAVLRWPQDESSVSPKQLKAWDWLNDRPLSELMDEMSQ
ncbi:MAG TPA: hypothetical protein VIR01_13615 [Pyrinomonadaceae bacterium]